MSSPSSLVASTSSKTGSATSAQICVPFDSIREPGTYVCNWSGHLLRIPQGIQALGGNPVITIVGAEPLYVTKICENPYVAITQARLLAADRDLSVRF